MGLEPRRPRAGATGCCAQQQRHALAGRHDHHTAGRPGACTVLVVEDVFANGYVRVVLTNSVGVLDPHMLQPRYWRAAGRVVAGTLRFELPIPTRPEFTYQFAGNALAGTARAGTVERLATAPG